MKHKWEFDATLSNTDLGKRLGGFSRCVRCGCLRFSRAGKPPEHAYVASEVVANKPDHVRFGSPAVRPWAGPCGANMEDAEVPGSPLCGRCEHPVTAHRGGSACMVITGTGDEDICDCPAFEVPR